MGKMDFPFRMVYLIHISGDSCGLFYFSQQLCAGEREESNDYQVEDGQDSQSQPEIDRNIVNWRNCTDKIVNNTNMFRFDQMSLLNYRGHWGYFKP